MEIVIRKNKENELKIEGGNKVEDILLQILDEIKSIKEDLQPKKMNIGTIQVSNFDKIMDSLKKCQDKDEQDVESSDELVEDGSKAVNNVTEDEVLEGNTNTQVADSSASVDNSVITNTSVYATQSVDNSNVITDAQSNDVETNTDSTVTDTLMFKQ